MGRAGAKSSCCKGIRVTPTAPKVCAHGIYQSCQWQLLVVLDELFMTSGTWISCSWLKTIFKKSIYKLISNLLGVNLYFFPIARQNLLHPTPKKQGGGGIKGSYLIKVFSALWIEVRSAPAVSTSPLQGMRGRRALPAPPRSRGRTKATPPSASGRWPRRRPAKPRLCTTAGPAVLLSPSPRSHTRLGPGAEAPAHVAAAGEPRRCEKRSMRFLYAGTGE